MGVHEPTSLERFLNGIFDLLTIVFLSRRRTSPLHFFGRVGLVFGVVGLGISLYFVALWIGGTAMRLRPLMLLGISFLLVSMQFFSLGLLALLAGNPAEGRVRCYDMLKLRGSANSIAEGAATTTQMTDAIIAKLG